MTMSSTTARTASTSAVGLLVATELGSGFLQGWYGPLLATIGERFDASAASLNLVAVAYLLSSVIFVPLLTKLGDEYGHKKLLLVAVAVTALGSLIVALAPSFALLLVGRVLQGALVAFLPLEYAIVRQRSPRAVDSSIGTLIAALAIGALIGGGGSGILFDATGSLSLTLAAPAIYMVVCLVAIAIWVPETETRRSGSMDWAGVVLLGVGAASVLGGVSFASSAGWMSPIVWVLIFVGLAVLMAWARVEKAVAQPFVDLRVFTRGGIGRPMVIGVMFSAQALGAMSLASIFIRVDPDQHGYGFGFSATQAGLVLSLAAFAGFLGSLLGPRVVVRVGYRATAIAASLVGAASYVLMVVAAPTAFAFIAWVACGGLATGTMNAVMPAVVVNRAKQDDVAVVSGVYNTARTGMGAAVGAIFSSVLAAFVIGSAGLTGAAEVTQRAGYAVVWSLCALLCLAAAAVCLRLEPADGKAQRESQVPQPTSQDVVAVPAS